MSTPTPKKRPTKKTVRKTFKHGVDRHVNRFRETSPATAARTLLKLVDARATFLGMNQLPGSLKAIDEADLVAVLRASGAIEVLKDRFSEFPRRFSTPGEFVMHFRGRPESTQRGLRIAFYDETMIGASFKVPTDGRVPRDEHRKALSDAERLRLPWPGLTLDEQVRHLSAADRSMHLIAREHLLRRFEIDTKPFEAVVVLNGDNGKALRIRKPAVLQLTVGHRYVSRDGELWTCFRDDGHQTHAACYCVREDQRIEYFYRDGRYDEAGMREHTLLAEVVT